MCYVARFDWKPDDPEIVSDVLFAVANVLSIARTTYLVVWWYDRAHRTHAAPTRTSVSRAPPTW